MNQHPTTSLRQAALLLHAMPVSDRAWLLAELSESQQEVLDNLLQELHELGIPTDRRLIDLAVKTPDDPTDHLRTPFPPFTRLDEVDETDLAALAQVLRHEPPGLIARLLQVRRWTWQTRLLAQLGTVQRRQVEDALESSTPPVGPALQRALLETIGHRVQQQRLLLHSTLASSTAKDTWHARTWRRCSRLWVRRPREADISHEQ